MKVVMVTGSRMDVDSFTLIEKDIFTKNGEFLDSVCEIRRGKSKVFAVYCSINDALAHKCEWLEE